LRRDALNAVQQLDLAREAAAAVMAHAAHYCAVRACRARGYRAASTHFSSQVSRDSSVG
jgi:hypothetical protein